MEMIREEAYPKAGPVPEITITSLLGKVASYDPEADEELIARAYSTAHAAHKDQVRKSGEPFVYHPLATADILADLLRYSGLFLGFDHGVALQSGGLDGGWYPERAGGDPAFGFRNVPAAVNRLDTRW